MSVPLPSWTNDLLITHGLIYNYVNSVGIYKCPTAINPLAPLGDAQPQLFDERVDERNCRLEQHGH